MSVKLLISILLIGSVVISARKVNDYSNGDEEENDVIETKTVGSTEVPKATTFSTSRTTPKEILIDAELKPDFISTRSGHYQTLECTVKLCDTNDADDDTDVDTGFRFVQPLFDWNSQLEHIAVTNGTCDYQRLNCWSSIDIDLRYFSNEMFDNTINEIQLSCSVSDYLSTKDGNGIQWAVNTDYSSVKAFMGRGIDESCESDSQCGDNMFCLSSGRKGSPVCQCSVDLLTGVPYVQVIEDKYNELICMPPLRVNDSCLYDLQCQAMDSNSVCGEKHTDSIDYGTGICQCAEDMVYTENRCETRLSVEVETKPTIIWWIFTDYSGDDGSSVHRFWWLRTASYVMAVLAIFLPISLIFIALIILCYRRVLSKHRSQSVAARPKFPSAAAPKIIINDFIRKEKSDDKYDLVKNDHLIGQ